MISLLCYLLNDRDFNVNAKRLAYCSIFEAQIKNYLFNYLELDQ